MPYASLFGNDVGTLTKQVALRQLPAFRDTGWRPLKPHQWPDLRSCYFISHDTENKENDFNEAGPGWARGAVSIVGHSLTGYWRDGHQQSLYIPMRHEIDTHLNVDPDTATRYVRDMLQTADIPKGYANGIYDVGTSTEDAVYVQGQLHEIQFAEALISEDDNVRLEALAHKYLEEHKETNELYDWCSRAYGGEANSSQRGNIYRTSPLLAGPYAEQDSALILPILSKQWPCMEAEDLLPLYRMECDLIRLLVRMRLQGVAIDIPYVEQLRDKVRRDRAEKIAEFYGVTGIHTSDSCPTGDIAKAFDQLGIAYRVTEKTKKPSITADDLKLIDHPSAKIALDIRQLDKIDGTFLTGALLERHVNGIVHGSFEPLRGDESGARSGRFASNNPNLQNIPVRTELGKLLRKAFIPFHGHWGWRKNDYSQYEYRWLAHYAVGPGSDDLRAKYNADPNTDFHTATEDQIKTHAQTAYAGWLASGLDSAKIRKRVKTVNFGNMNLMGVDLLCATLSIPRKEGEQLLKAYHEANPYIKATVTAAETFARTNGYIATELGRRSRFDLWEPAQKEWIEAERRFKFVPALRYGHAISQYGSNIQRARCHIALNRLTQGGNADGIKKAMVAIDQSGVLDVTGVPTITVHDELDFSQRDDTPLQREAHAFIIRTMETALPLRVPTKVDSGTGPNWGSID